MADNLALYNKYAEVPESAKKTIGGGRLKGMTDINPMWRIKCLTEEYGPCGFGWYPAITKQWIEEGANGEKSAFCDIDLYLHDSATKEWSMPISATGGASFVANEKNGPFTSDECFKMAYTDALSVACKMLGFGANTYWDKDKTKYDRPKQTDDDPLGTGRSAGTRPAEQGKFICSVCGAEINKAMNTLSTNKFGKPLCLDCQKKECK